MLDARGRRQALGVALAMIVGGLFEAIGVGLVVPFVAVMTAPESVSSLPLIGGLVGALGLTEPRSFALVAGLALVAVFVVKNLWIAWQTHLQFRFAYDNQVRLARRLFTAYLNAPYEMHLRRNSVDLLRVLNQDCLWVFNHVVIPLLTVLAEFVVVGMIAVVLMFFAPGATLVAAAVLGLTGVAFFAWVRRRTRVLGAVQQAEVGKMMRTVRESLGAIKETRAIGREQYFVDVYGRSGELYADANTWLKSVAALPRVFVETIGVTAVMGFAVYSVARDVPAAQVLPSLGLFAMAAMRLMPSFNRVVTSITGLRFYLPAVDAVAADLALVDSTERAERRPPRAAQGAVELELRGLGVRYANGPTAALDSLNLRFMHGESIGIVGPSGAGKTTLVDVLLGLIQPTTGVLAVNGVPLDGPLRQAGVSVGYVPQTVFLRDENVRRNVAFGVADDEIDDARVWKALEQAQLDDVVRALPRGLDENLGEGGTRLSGGQRQRIGVARSLYFDPSVLVLDEATSALDTETEREVTRALHGLKRTRTIFVIAHRLSTVRACDRVIVLRGGQVEADGTWDEALAASPTLRGLVAADERSG
jgi:ABC-type multidrug transport system fused ATPase/permease subunit